MNKLTVHSASWNLSLAANSSTSVQFNIPAQLREFKVRSIRVDWFIYVGAVSVVPWRLVTDQSIYLQVGGWPEKIAQPFTITGGAIPNSNGQYLIITEPGQWFFNSFHASNSLPFVLTVNNMRASVVDHTISITVETQDLANGN